MQTGTFMEVGFEVIGGKSAPRCSR